METHTLITGVTPEELAEMVATAVRNELDKQNAKFPTKEYLTKKEAAEFLGISQGSVQNYMRQGKLSKKRLAGHDLRFHVDDLKNLIKD